MFFNFICWNKVMQFLNFFILLVGVLVGVAFFTLFERKLLGYIQLRKGPNKVGFMGILQPFSDAIKLFTKEHVGPYYANYFPFLLAPVIGFALALLGWMSLPSAFNFLSFDLSVLFFLCCVGLGVYLLLAAGWSSNSKYSLLGALRGVAQTISYEVSLVLLLLSPLILSLGYEWMSLSFWQQWFWFIWILPVSWLCVFISCLAETNRTPFDFAEGESELVSGYNTEYNSGGFALLMLAEYTSILFMSFLLVILYMGGDTMFSFISFLFMAFLFVWVRGTLPRFRYDKLMNLAWTVLLPFSLFVLFFVSSLLIFSF
nr:NADH dehydrogenase subunit 1 [Ovalona pulchella]